MDISCLQNQQQKQKLCQSQEISLKILTMNNFELKDFLQTELMKKSNAGN